MDRNPVSIIIPNFNGADLLENNLPAVAAAVGSYGGGGEIIIVDDASSDRSRALIAEKFPQVRLVCHAVNRGFAEAVHSGVGAAANDILILLNSDVRPHADFIAPLLETLTSDRDVFSVSPMIYNRAGKPQNVSWNRYAVVRGTVKSTRWDMNAIEERKAAGGRLKSLFASGGSVALKKPLFLKLGGFLSIYKPFYNEDMDLCTRAWIRGWQTLFEPRSKVVHDHVGTIKTFFHAHKIRTIRTRNRFLYLWLYCSRYRLTVSHIPWTSFRLLLRLLRLDTSFPIGLLQGLTRLRTVMALRSRMKSERLFKPLDHILNDINA